MDIESPAIRLTVAVNVCPAASVKPAGVGTVTVSAVYGAPAGGE